MSSTTQISTMSSSTTTTAINWDYVYAMFPNPMIVVQFYQIGFPLTLLIGFIGNFASIFIFFQPSLRKVSTSCLFILLGIADTVVLFMYILDIVEFGWRIPFYKKMAYDEICKFRSFMINVFQVLSSWILVVISMDRWIRARFPYKSLSLCTPKYALLVVSILLVIISGLHVPFLTPLFGTLIPGFSILACGPSTNYVNYFIFYYLQWSIIQIVVLCILPVTLMFIFLIDIFVVVRVRKRAVVHTIQSILLDRQSRRQKYVQMQMLILMLSSIVMFLLTMLPVSIYKITSPRQANLSSEFLTIVNIWTIFGWIQSLNYAIHFYSHCLTSTLFRKEFKQQIQRIFLCKPVQLHSIDQTVTKRDTRSQIP